MPVVGVVDPSHWEDQHNLQGRQPHWYTPEELIQLSRFKGPKWSSWTTEMLNVALEDELSGRKHERVSVTSLLGCPRSTVVERKADYITTVAEKYAAIRGSMIHRTLEAGGRPGAIVEGHFLTRVNGIEVSCIIDVITPEGDQYDYKTSDTYPAWNPYRGQTLQLQYNAYIARNAVRFTSNTGEVYGEKPKELREGQVYMGPDLPDIPEIRSASIVYLTPKEPKIITIEKKQKWTAPNGREVEGKRPYIWTDAEVELGEKRNEPGLIERVELLRQALDIFPEFPEGAEKVWGGPAGYQCPGKPWCSFPNCTAKRYPHALVWDRNEEDAE